MWPFNKRYSLAESGVLDGLTDWHCHLLPGVDDGVKTMEESLSLLSFYEQLGIREVWLTPHVMEDIPNTTEELKTRYEELKTAYKGPLVLHLASENMLDNLFEERLQAGDLLPLGQDGRYLLVETSYYNPPYGLHDILRRVQSKGYHPVLAHPERYVYMDQKAYEQLKQQNISFQLNLPSLVGAYGPNVKKRADWLLKNKFYQFSGTDTHRLKAWEHVAHVKHVSKRTLKYFFSSEK